MILEETSRSLAAARDKLAAWQSRLDALDVELRRLGARERRHVEALRKTVEEQFERLSNDVIRLESIERTWRSMRAHLQRDARDLDRAYRRLRDVQSRGADA